MSKQEPVKNYVFGYGRGSTDKQVITLDAQRQACESWFDLQQRIGRFTEFDWAGWYADGDVSSEIYWFQRPMGQILLQRLREGDIVVVSMTDRACGAGGDVEQSVEKLVKIGAKAVFLDNPSLDMTCHDGVMILSLMAVLKRHQREQTRYRTKQALQYKISKGEPAGPAPLGWYNFTDKNGTKSYKPDYHDRAIAEYIFRLIQECGLKAYEVHERLECEDVRRSPHQLKNIAGKTLSLKTVRRLYYAYQAGFPLPLDRLNAANEKREQEKTTA